MSVKIAIAQVNLTVGDVAGNVQRIIEAATDARDRLRAALVVFPELTLTGYPPEDLLLRPSFIDAVEQGLATLREQVRGIDVVVGYPRRHGRRLYNAAGVLRDGEVLVEYFKSALPNYSVFDEKRYFEPGSEPCVFECAGVRFGLSVCEDVWEQTPTARAASAGAQVLLNLNASPYHLGKWEEREQLLSQRAADNGLGIVYVNLVGGQDELVFDGRSLLVDAGGEVVGRCDAFAENIQLVELDDDGSLLPARLSPVLEDEAAVYQALVLGVRDYVQKNGFNGAVLGLSGGIDSALVLAIAVDALGPENVEVVMMPSRYTADMSNQDAALQAERLGVAYSSIPIEPAFNAFLGMLEDEFAGLPADTTEENIQARCRGIILMAISNKKGRILLTTGNKSEMSVGYATLYGDMAGGFAPIKDVPKMMVYRLAEYRNREQEIIPQRVIERPPSAELRPDQQDSDSLPDYAVLDEVLHRYVELDQGRAEIIAAGFDEQLVRRVARLVDLNEYKRRQAPPGVKVTGRAFGRDRRYPLTNGFC